MSEPLKVDGLRQNQKPTPVRTRITKIFDTMCNVYEYELAVKHGLDLDLDDEPAWVATRGSRSDKATELIEEIGQCIMDLGPNFEREYHALSYVAQTVKVYFSRVDLISPAEEYDWDYTDIHEILTEDVVTSALMGTRQLVESLLDKKHLCLKCRKRVQEMPVVQEEPEED